jgi:hypothetical protein
MGDDGTAPRILKFGTRWRWKFNFTPLKITFYTQNPLNIEVDGSQGLCGRFITQKKFSFLSGVKLRLFDRTACSLVMRELNW